MWTILCKDSELCGILTCLLLPSSAVELKIISLTTMVAVHDRSLLATVKGKLGLDLHKTSLPQKLATT